MAVDCFGEASMVAQYRRRNDIDNTSEDARFAADERPGGAHVSSHPRSRKIGHAATGAKIALLGTFGNSLVSPGLNVIGGEYGLYPFEASWLTIASTGISATASLFLITECQQFGIGRIIKVLP